MSKNAAEPLVELSSRVSLRRVAAWLEAHAVVVIVAFAAVYAVATAALAWRKPLGNDELFTYLIARVPSLGDLWRALESGAEQTPPLSHLLTRASFGLFGRGHLAARLPELVAFLVFCLCSYAFVARRSNRLYGLVAMLFPTVTVAYFYAFEARAYALVLAFGSLALLSWQLATEGVRRRAALMGLAASLALATASNYYAVLLLLPLGLGELVRTRATRRIDRAVWLSLAGALVPLIAFEQLIRASRSYSAHFWGHASWRSPTNFYAFLVSTRLTGKLLDRDLALLALTALALALVVLATRRRLPSSGRDLAALCLGVGVLPTLGLLAAGALGTITLHRREAVAAVLLLALASYVAVRARSGRPLLDGPPAHEVAAAAGFLLIPLASAVLAAAVTHAYVPRYALPAAIGFSVLLPLALYRLEGQHPSVAVGVLAVLGACFLLVLVADWRGLTRTNARREQAFRFLEREAHGTQPILIADPHDFLELSHSPPRTLGQRFVYLADPQASIRAKGEDTAERGLLELRRIAPLRVYEYRAYLARHTSFLAFASRGPTELSWVLPALRADGRRVRLKAVAGDRALYEVGP